jgi:two-component system, LuxR family, response regulator FixJ
MAQAMIHIVDDDEAVRDSLQLLLETSGFTVTTYESGDAFLDRLPSPIEGCVLIDVRMPGRGGVEVQEELQHRAVAVPVIIMTGHADVPLAVRAMKAGAIDFVEKPFSDQLIIATINRALEIGATARRQDEAAAGIAQRMALLTQRERQVLDALVQGRPNKVIAYELSISPRTVEIHRARVMDKMQARSLSELVRMALTAEPVPPPQR